MNWELVIEIVGYVGMAFVILSFLFGDVLKLRILNVIGGSLSAVYGFLTKTYPTMALNIALVIINLVMIVCVLKTRKKKKLEEQIRKNEPDRETDRRE